MTNELYVGRNDLCSNFRGSVTYIEGWRKLERALIKISGLIFCDFKQLSPEKEAGCYFLYALRLY